jgi:PBSX family phage terminase large subunit
LSQIIEIYEPSEKAKKFYWKAQNYKLALAVGAVRSSKSYTCNQLAIDELRELPPCNVLLSGKSAGTVERNIITAWKDVLGKDKFKRVYDGDDRYWTINYNGLRDKNFYVVGAGKERDEEKIQGATFGYWLGDEIALHTKKFIDMAVSRLSLPYSKGRWTANPGAPNHVIKTDYIDNPDIKDIFYSEHFEITDNPALTKEYIEGLSRTYSGVFYKRFIKGMWVAAEGAIYDMFDEDIHCFTSVPHEIDYSRFQDIAVGVDYGTLNPTAFVLGGKDLRGKIHIINEWGYNGRKMQKQKTDAEYVVAMGQFIQSTVPGIDIAQVPIYVDPSAASFMQALRKEGYWVLKADNSVLDGIRDVQTKFNTDRLVINSCCTNLIEELQGYVWDEAAAEKGEDKPLKINDHWVDSLKYLVRSRWKEKWQ